MKSLGRIHQNRNEERAQLHRDTKRKRTPPSTRIPSVCYGDIVKGIRDVYRSSWLSFGSVVQLRDEYRRLPALKALELQIVDCIRGAFFKDYLIVLAKCRTQLEFSVLGSAKKIRKKRIHLKVEKAIEWMSMHFVHEKVYDPGVGDRGSFEIQSIWKPGRPCELECCQRLMVHAGLGLHAAAKYPSLCFDDGPIAVLGMGGNVISNCLAFALPKCDIHVVEVEPAVVACCVKHLGFPPRKGVFAHEGDVIQVLPLLPDNCSFVFLDCFDPLSVSMMHGMELIQLSFNRLAPNGTLVTNAHIAADDFAVIVPFVRVFGSGHVHLINYAKLRQEIIVCTRTCEDIQRSLTAPVFAKVTHFVNEAGILGPLVLDSCALHCSSRVVLPSGEAFRRWNAP